LGNFPQLYIPFGLWTSNQKILINFLEGFGINKAFPVLKGSSPYHALSSFTTLNTNYLNKILTFVFVDNIVHSNEKMKDGSSFFQVFVNNNKQDTNLACIYITHFVMACVIVAALKQIITVLL
jgi:hypothetical protein